VGLAINQTLVVMAIKMEASEKILVNAGYPPALPR
jgi:hypothetical protein